MSTGHGKVKSRSRTDARVLALASGHIVAGSIAAQIKDLRAGRWEIATVGSLEASTAIENFQLFVGAQAFGTALILGADHIFVDLDGDMDLTLKTVADESTANAKYHCGLVATPVEK